MAKKNRDDFRAPTRRSLALRVRHACSRPECRAPTIGPGSASPEDTASVGVAAHICAAAPGGPRYDGTMTRKERRAIDNGIWLCTTCSTLIDRDHERFPIEMLREWKSEHEAAVKAKIGQPGGGLEGFDAKIDAAAALFRDREIAAGLDRLGLIRRGKWDRLTQRQRYRLLANIGAGHQARGELHEAAALFTQAATYQPEDPDAQAFLARADEIGGDIIGAFELAEDLIKARACKRAAGTYIRCAPASFSTETLAKATSLWQRDQEVLVALVVRAHNEKNFDLAEQLATQLNSLFPAMPDGPLLLGKAGYARQTVAMHADSTQAAPKFDIQGLEEVEKHLSEAHQRALAKRFDAVAADALLARNQVRMLLGKSDAAVRDIEEAARLAPTEPEILVARAISFGARERELAIQLLRDALRFGGGNRARLFLGLRLKEVESDHLEALKEFSAVAGEDGPLREDALGLAFGLAVRLDLPDETESLIALASEVDSVLHLTLQAELALSRGESGAALALALDASADVEEGATTASTRRRLADVLARVDENNAALKLWEGLVVQGLESPDLWNLMATANALGMHDMILEHCSVLRKGGAWIADYVNLESSLLEQYDPEAAYVLLDQYLARHPEDKLATLRRCLVCVRTGRDDEAIVSLSALPSPEGNLIASINTAQLLHFTGQHAAALAYSYDVLRAHWAEPDAHLLFFRVHLQTEPHLRPDSPGEIAAGSAVCHRELNRETERWTVIEDSDNVYQELGEVRHENALAKLLHGHVVGDVVTLSDGLEPRRAEILRIEHKYVYRWQQCGEEFQPRFPGRTEIQSFQIDDGAECVEERFATMYKAAEQRAERVSDILAAYRDSAVTLHTLAEALGIDVATCIMGLAADPNQAVRATLPEGKRSHRFTKTAADSGVLVLTLSAFGTILALGIEDAISDWDWELQVTPGTRDVLAEFIRKNKDPRERGTFGKTPSGHVFEKIDIDKKQSIGQRVEALLDRCLVASAMPLAKMKTEEREMLTKLHGQSGAESIAVTLGQTAVCWADDYTFAFTADAYGGLACGTQSILYAAVRRGRLSRQQADGLSAGLLGLEFETTWFTPSIVAKAAEFAGWNPANPPFSKIVRLLGMNERPPLHIVASALDCIYEVSQNLDIDVSRTAAITVVLNTIGQRENGNLLVEQILRTIPSRFGLSAVRSLGAQQIVRSWLGAKSGP